LIAPVQYEQLVNIVVIYSTKHLELWLRLLPYYPRR